jgi:hypothetical protein
MARGTVAQDATRANKIQVQTSSAVAPSYSVLRCCSHRRYWRGDLITGVFSPRTKLRRRGRSPRAAALYRIRKRKILRDRCAWACNPFIANPHLLKTSDEALAALAGWPLGEPNILNARGSKAADHLLNLVDMISNLRSAKSTDLSRMPKGRRIPSSNAGRNGP